jgi:hypothetical protein
MRNAKRVHHEYWPKALRLLAIVALTVSGTHRGWASEAGPMLTVRIDMPETVVHPGDRVKLSIELENLSDQGMLMNPNRTVDMSSGIVVKDPSGNIAPGRADFSKIRPRGSRFAQGLKAHEHLQQVIDLTGQYKLAVLGSYVVYVVKHDPVTHQDVTSNTINFTVE